VFDTPSVTHAFRVNSLMGILGAYFGVLPWDLPCFYMRFSFSRTYYYEKLSMA